MARRWFGWFRSDPKKEMRKAAEAFTSMQSRNIDVGKGMGKDDRRNVSLFDAYGSVIEDYLKEHGNTEEDDKDINALKDAYLLYKNRNNPSDQQQNPSQENNTGSTGSNAVSTGSNASSTGSRSTEAPKNEDNSSTQAPTATQAPTQAPKTIASGTPAASRTTEDKLKEHFAKTELHHELGDKEKDELSKGIDPAAMHGMQEISLWMLRNCVKSGSFRSAKTADENINYIHNFVLKQPARVKLYAYYMIEKKKRKEDDPAKMSANIAASQLDYTPNLEEFKSKMIATRFKFWKRLTGSEIYWSKMQEAFLAARDSKDQLKPFGDMSLMDVSGAKEENPEPVKDKTPATDNTATSNAQPGGSTVSAATPSAATPSNSNTDQAQENDPVKAKALERQNKYKQFMNKGKDIIRLKNEMKNLDAKGKKAKEDEIRAAAGELAALLQELYGADKAVDSTAKSFKMDVSNAAKERKASKGSFYGGMGGMLVGAGGSGFKATGDNDYFSWGLDKNTEEGLAKLKDVQAAGDIISIVGASISILSLVTHTIDVISHGKEMTTGAKIMAGMDITTSALSTAKSMTTAIQGVMGASKDAISQVGGAVGIAAGSVGILTGAVGYYNAKKQKHKSAELEKTFENRRKTASNDPQQTEELKESKKARDTARLTHRLSDVRENLAMAKMTTGALDVIGGALAVSGVAAGFGALFSGLSAAINLGVYFYKLAKKKKIIFQTIDDFIDMDSIYSDVIGSDKVEEDQGEQIKRQIRIKAASELGFSSRENLFNAITAEYAKNIYMHVFFKKGSKTVKATCEGDADPDYIKLIKTLRLKPEYGSRKPNVNTIAYQLQNL